MWIISLSIDIADSKRADHKRRRWEAKLSDRPASQASAYRQVSAEYIRARYFRRGTRDWLRANGIFTSATASVVFFKHARRLPPRSDSATELSRARFSCASYKNRPGSRFPVYAG